jgi:hypothetical protein
MNTTQHVQSHSRTSRVRASLYGFATMAVLCAAALPAATYAQSTTANIFGKAPAGETVIARSSSGLHRDAKANARGLYKITSLPAGDYTVTLEKDGQTVDKQSNVALIVGRGAEVDFACPNDQCASR